MGTYYFLLHLHNTYKSSSQTYKKRRGKEFRVGKGGLGEGGLVLQFRIGKRGLRGGEFILTAQSCYY